MADPHVATIPGNTGLPLTTKVVFGIGIAAVFAELKIPGYDESNNVCDRGSNGLVKDRILSPVLAATNEKTLAPTSYLPRVGRFQLASTVAI